MYINRKTGELVEAKYCIEDGFWDVEDLNGNRINTLNEPGFFAQYGEAMVKTIGTVHIKNECCEMGYCIPYIPEQKEQPSKLVPPPRFDKVFKEGYANMCEEEASIPSVFIPDSKPIEQSNLMLSDEEICSKILHCGKSNIETCRKLEQRCDYLYDIKSGIRAELDHLKGLGIVYVKVSCDECRDFSYNEYCGHCGGYRVLNIPLSDYKGEK